MDDIFFSGWPALFRVAVSAVIGYITLVALLRISGRRTLAKMNAFDLVVTVALGSVLASIILSKSVTLFQGALALALLIGMQYAVTWSSVRMSWVRQLVTGEPALLFYQGQALPDALRKARVTQDELQAAVRASGLIDMSEVQAVVLETDGSFSVMSNATTPKQSSLEDVMVPGSQQI
nr:YetF domain-containing protein [uncultured Halomonas sp.]